MTYVALYQRCVLGGVRLYPTLSLPAAMNHSLCNSDMRVAVMTEKKNIQRNQ